MVAPATRITLAPVLLTLLAAPAVAESLEDAEASLLKNVHIDRVVDYGSQGIVAHGTTEKPGGQGQLDVRIVCGQHARGSMTVADDALSTEDLYPLSDKFCGDFIPAMRQRAQPPGR